MTNREARWRAAWRERRRLCDAYSAAFPLVYFPELFMGWSPSLSKRFRRALRRGRPIFWPPLPPGAVM